MLCLPSTHPCFLVGSIILRADELLEVVGRACVDSGSVVTEIEKLYRKQGAMIQVVDLEFLLPIAVLITKKTYVD